MGAGALGIGMFVGSFLFLHAILADGSTALISAIVVGFASFIFIGLASS